MFRRQFSRIQIAFEKEDRRYDPTKISGDLKKKVDFCFKGLSVYSQSHSVPEEELRWALSLSIMNLDKFREEVKNLQPELSPKTRRFTNHLLSKVPSPFYISEWFYERFHRRNGRGELFIWEHPPVWDSESKDFSLFIRFMNYSYSSHFDYATELAKKRKRNENTKD
jgi:hypothetical protein